MRRACKCELVPTKLVEAVAFWLGACELQHFKNPKQRVVACPLDHSCSMFIRPSSTLLVARLCRFTGYPTALRNLAPDCVLFKSHWYLTSDRPSENVSRNFSLYTRPNAQEEVATSTHKPYFPEPDPSLPIVEYQTRAGSARRNVKVSAKTDVALLTAALSPLLVAHSSTVIRDTRSVGSKGWDLLFDSGLSGGATILRFFAFNSEADAANFIESVRRAADEMDHHPEIACLADRRTNSTLRYVAVSCSTHRPPGLSMRDVRLAKKINELAETFDYMAKDPKTGPSARATRKDLIRQLRKPKSGTEPTPPTSV
jgi:pterin-4a-carbinolamine dehydratase